MQGDDCIELSTEDILMMMEREAQAAFGLSAGEVIDGCKAGLFNRDKAWAVLILSDLLPSGNTSL